MPDTPQAGRKTCTKCHAEKSTDGFTVRLRDADGNPRKWFSQCHECHTASAAAIKAAGTRVARDYVPVGPFIEWIERKIVQYEGIEKLARACGKRDARQLRRVLRESASVSIYVVDEWLTGERSTLLYELYPVEDEAERLAA